VRTDAGLTQEQERFKWRASPVPEKPRVLTSEPGDGIMVTAAANHVPVPLVQQLKPGGRMVIPVGTSFLTQQLMLIEKRPDGSVTTQQILPVRFVPLTGRH